MAAPSGKRRQPLPSHLADASPETLRQHSAAFTIQGAFRGYRARQELQRLKTLDTAGAAVYGKLRVYHGTHEEYAHGILQTGLVPQGGQGLTGMIGHTTASLGKVFFTRDKQQAAYYANTLSGMEQADRVHAANRIHDYDAACDAMKSPKAPTIMRVLVPPSVQKDAVHDDKGGDDDYTLARSLQPGLVLPGHLDPDADVTQRRGAVTLFQRELTRSGVNTTRAEAETTLARQRRKSISGDTAALSSPYAVESAKQDVLMYRFKKGMS